MELALHFKFGLNEDNDDIDSLVKSEDATK
jgi:hypothetical protein